MYLIYYFVYAYQNKFQNDNMKYYVYTMILFCGKGWRENHIFGFACMCIKALQKYNSDSEPPNICRVGKL